MGIVYFGLGVCCGLKMWYFVALFGYYGVIKPLNDKIYVAIRRVIRFQNNTLLSNPYPSSIGALAVGCWYPRVSIFKVTLAAVSVLTDRSITWWEHFVSLREMWQSAKMYRQLNYMGLMGMSRREGLSRREAFILVLIVWWVPVHDNMLQNNMCQSAFFTYISV